MGKGAGAAIVRTAGATSADPGAGEMVALELEEDFTAASEFTLILDEPQPSLFIKV